MAKARPKFYAVWKGHAPGVYSDWGETSRQVAGYSGAIFKGFASLAEAQAAFREPYSKHWGKHAEAVRPALPELEPDAVAVDAACAGVPGPMEYRGVHIASGDLLFQAGPFEDGTNNVGEFLALVHALALLAKQGKTDVTIYSDSKTALSWVRKGKCRTKLERSDRNGRIFELIARADAWLAAHSLVNPLCKWETAEWGEIPADYGRK